MRRILVCPLSRLDATLAQCGAEAVVTLLRRGETQVVVPPGLRHLWLDLNDISEPRDGHAMPGTAHIEDLVRFARYAPPASSAVIHCYAGVSRSTAAAFVVACALQPGKSEADLAQMLRRVSPTATPNARIVALADTLLGRSGRMVEAIQAIGRGTDCFEGIPFSLEIDNAGG